MSVAQAPVEYSSGKVVSQRYVNDSVGLSYPIPDSCRQTQSSSELAELSLCDTDDASTLEIAYGGAVDELPTEIAVAETYAAAHQREKAGFWSSVILTGNQTTWVTTSGTMGFGAVSF